MDHNPQDNRYEQLYEGILSRAVWLHERNKTMIKWGSIMLIVLPVILFVVRWLTHSDKMVFLLIWVFCLFALAAFLIAVEYLDHTVQRTIREIMDEEAEFDDLLQPQKTIPGKIIGRVSNLQDRVDTKERMKMYGVAEPDEPESRHGEDGDDSE